MSDKEILEKAIQKAIDNSWAWKDIDWDADNRPYELIYNHEFAKALWGEKHITEYYPSPVSKPAFVYHLQQMVIAEDPIKYLGDNI